MCSSKKLGICLSVLKDTWAILFALREFYCYAVIFLCNISPKVRYAKHIMIADGNHITLCAAKNTTKKILPEKEFYFLFFG